MSDTRTTIPTTGELVVTSCWCGIQYAVPRDFYRWHCDDKSRPSHCPLGHPGYIRTTTQQRLEQAEARERHLADQLHAAEAEAEARRVQLIRDRHRFANGVCPCCNRSFENVARHMKTQHPDYDPADLTVPKCECSCGRTFDTPHGLRIHQARSRRGDWLDPKRGPWGRHLTVVSR